MKKILFTSIIMAGILFAPAAAHSIHINDHLEICSIPRIEVNDFNIDYDANSNIVLFYSKTFENDADEVIKLTIYDADENILAGEVIDKRIVRIRINEKFDGSYFIYRIFRNNVEVTSGKLPISR